MSRGSHWALVLGGSSGLGLACARQLAKDGFDLCLVYREPRVGLRRLEPHTAEMRQLGRQVLELNIDAVGEAGRARIVEELARVVPPGGLAVLLHSIAQGHLKPLSGNNPLSSDDLRRTIDAMGVSLQAWVSTLHEQKLFTSDARVIALTSAGARRVWPGYAAVSAAKATLEAVVRALAVEFGASGIRTNAVQAGITDTPSLRRVPGAQRLLEQAHEGNPLGRLTRPEDVAAAVGLLCRPEAAWVNGALLAVDGGEHLL